METRIEADRFLTDRFPARWLALKYLEGDTDVIALGRANGPTAVVLEEMAATLSRHIEATLASTPDAVISDHRYGYIAAVLRQGVLKSTAARDRIAGSDSLDRVLTHTVAGPVMPAATSNAASTPFCAARPA